MDTMTALRGHRRGGPEVLVLEQAPLPSASPGDVVVEVSAAAITFAELEWEETWRRDGVDRTPSVPGHEVSGRVHAVGEGVAGLRVGDDVLGLVPFDRDGAAAEYVALPAANLALKPAEVSHTTAAALPVAGLTAWQALLDHGRLRPGERVLVHGGAGGVGSFSVQLARHLGAEVVATARGDQAALVRELGAGRVIDFEREAFDAEPATFDLVIDPVGGQTLDRSYAVLKPGGRLITLQNPPSQERAAQHGVTATFFIVTFDRDEVEQLLRLVQAAQVRVLIAGTYPLAEGRAAFESGGGPDRAPGKTVLLVGG